MMSIAIRAVAVELAARQTGATFLAGLAGAGGILFAVQWGDDWAAHWAYDWRKEAFPAAWRYSTAVAVVEGFLASKFLQRQAFCFRNEEGNQRATKHEAGEDLH